MATTPIPKYRPYLSMEEMDALIDAAVFLAQYQNPDAQMTVPTPTDALISAQASLLKTKTLASLGLQKEAYKTNPRPTMLDKLGFGDPTEQIPALNRPLPDFSSLMEELTNMPNPGENNVND